MGNAIYNGRNSIVRIWIFQERYWVRWKLLWIKPYHNKECSRFCQCNLFVWWPLYSKRNIPLWRHQPHGKKPFFPLVTYMEYFRSMECTWRKFLRNTQLRAVTFDIQSILLFNCRQRSGICNKFTCHNHQLFTISPFHQRTGNRTLCIRPRK